MSDIDKLVENYFRSKDDFSLGDLFQLIQEQVEVVGPPIKEEVEAKFDAKQFILNLPKFTPSEAWGKPNSVARQEIEKFLKPLRGGRDIQKRIEYINRLQSVVPKKGREITSPRRIISTLILLESLGACVNSFGASTAGFVFEGFLAAILGGHQVSDPKEGGSLPIEDIVAFSTWDGEGEKMSLKLLKKSTDIKGSYTNLITALTKEEQMVYVIAYKEGDGADVSALHINSFVLSRSNFLTVMSQNKKNMTRITLTKMEPQRNAAQSLNFLSQFSSWEELLPYLQRTEGYTGEVLPLPGEEEQEVIEPQTESRQELTEATGGKGWSISRTQIENNIPDDLQFKQIGTLTVSPDALEKTATRYMGVLQGSISTLFEAVASLSDNINKYFVVKNRGTAINRGNEAIDNADAISEQMATQTKDTDDEPEETA
jgi:hypothetical protein